MTNLSEILKSLSDLVRINYFCLECDAAILVEKYDKNNNSIFEGTKPDTLKTDLIKFGSQNKNLDKSYILMYNFNV